MSVKVIFDGSVEASVTRESLGEIQMDFSFDNFSPNFELLEDWSAEFIDRGPGQSGNAVTFINDWIEANGLQNNLPTTLIDTHTGEKLLDGFTDLSNPANQYDDLKCIYKLIVRNRISSFADQIEGLNLRTLASSPVLPGDAKINASDKQILRYIRSQVPDFSISTLLLVTAYLLGVQLVQQITKLTQLVAKAATTPAFFGGAVGALLWWGLEVITNIAITAFLIIALVQLLKDLSNLLFAKPVPVNTVGVKTLFEKGCKALGYTFQSTLFDGDYANMRYLASFNYDADPSGKTRITSPSNNPIPNISLGDLFERIGLMFNAKARITEDKRVIFENRDFFIQNPFNYQLPALKNEGTYTYNLSELPKSLKIKFAEDPVEKNTLINIKILGIKSVTNTTSSKGDQLSVAYELSGIKDADLSALTKEINVDLQFARAYRKDQQTFIERVFNTVWDVAQQLIGRNNNDLGDRIGYMLLDGDYMGTDKVLIQDGDRLSNKNFDLIHAETLYNRFWNIESPARNQWKIYSNRDRQPICDNSVFASIKENNVIYNQQGRLILIQRNVWDPITRMHELTYRERLNSSDPGFIDESEITETIIKDEDQ